MNFLTLATLSEYIQGISFNSIGMFFNYIQVFVIGIIALFLSALSFSGTWLITLSAVIFKIFDTTGKLDWITVILFVLVSIGVEYAELFAIRKGVKNAKGCKDSEIIGMLSGILGGFVGEIFIPIPFLGSLVGMFLLSFIGVYITEYRVFKKNGKALKVAWAGIAAKAFMIIFKLIVTGGMFIYLIYQIFH